MARAHLLLSAALVAVAAATPHTQAGTYRARLSVVPIDIAMQATIAGAGSVTATLEGTRLTIDGAYQGLVSAATAVRIHRGPRTAMRGPSIADLHASGGTSGTITGVAQLSAEQVDDLAAGRLYVQLHSEKAPDGNLWGWLLPQKGKTP